MSRGDTRYQKRYGSFWRKQTFNLMIGNDRLWVASCRGPNGGFASFLENSCRPGNAPLADVSAQTHHAANL
jgi:hypothetical protein